MNQQAMLSGSSLRTSPVEGSKITIVFEFQTSVIHDSSGSDATQEMRGLACLQDAVASRLMFCHGARVILTAVGEFLPDSPAHFNVEFFGQGHVAVVEENVQV